MRWMWCVLLVAACGRSHFDDAGQDVGGGGGTGDEDQDGFADGSDNCPAHFNQSQADRDGDRIGDACDPHPDAAGDKLVSAAFFATSFGDWTPDQASNWMLDAGMLVTKQPPDSTNARLSLSVTAPQGTLEVGYTVRDFGSNTATQTSLFNATLTAGSSSWSCHLVNNGGTAVLDTVQIYNDASYSGGRGLSNAVMVGGATELRATLDNAAIECRTPDAAFMLTGPTSANVSSASIQIYGMQVALEYVMVYAIP
jgi:hypothetical protein